MSIVLSTTQDIKMRQFEITVILRFVDKTVCQILLSEYDVISLGLLNTILSVL